MAPKLSLVFDAVIFSLLFVHYAKTHDKEISFDIPDRIEVVAKLYPNPTREKSIIEFDQNVGDFLIIRTLDMIGRTHMTKEKINMENETSVEIFVENLPTGQYYILIQVDGDLMRLPLVIVN